MGVEKADQVPSIDDYLTQSNPSQTRRVTNFI